MTREEREAPWFSQRLCLLDGRVRERLAAPARPLGEGPFTAGDLMMAADLFGAQAQKALEPVPGPVTRLARAEARPA